MSTTTLKRTKDGAYMVADLLEKGTVAPLVRHRAPYWSPVAPTALRVVQRSVRVPITSWALGIDNVAEGTPMVDIDANAAYLSAASSATFAHGELERTGPLGTVEKTVAPGYYLVNAYGWGHGAPGSPLGAGRIKTTHVWVTHTTYGLLRDLCVGASWTPGGHWPDATVHDSWTGDTACRLTAWTNTIRDHRTRFILEGDRDAYEALKLGYSQAIQMWNIPPDAKGTAAADRRKHTRAYRPDWYAALRAQHAANMWRRAWVATLRGYAPVAVGGVGHAVDGMAWTSSDLGAVLMLPVSPVRLDETGCDLGTFKRVRPFPYYAGIELGDDK